MFEVFLEKNMYLNATCKPLERLVDMYHAGTPNSVKAHISADTDVNENGNIRILISTVAFGMGVNCKKIQRVIHFGPSKSVEQYVQECGRAGRDEQSSICILLHNGFIMA